MGDRKGEVAAGGGDDPLRRHIGGEHRVEGAPGLERAAVLEQLELEAEPAADAEGAGLEVDNRGLAHAPLDPGGGGLDLVAPDQACGRAIAAKSRACSRIFSSMPCSSATSRTVRPELAACLTISAARS